MAAPPAPSALTARRGTTRLSRSSMRIANTFRVAGFRSAAMFATSTRLRGNSRHAVHSALTERTIRMMIAVAPRPRIAAAAPLAYVVKSAL